MEDHRKVNGYRAEKSRFRTSVFEVNGYAAEKSRSNVQNVHFFILFLNEWTSKCGVFTPHRSLEEPLELERV